MTRTLSLSLSHTHTHTHTHIYIYMGSVRGEMVTVVGNGHGNPSSNPGRY